MGSIRFSNKKKANLSTILIFIFSIIAIGFPLLLMYFFERSQISKLFQENIYILYFMILFLIYLIFTGVYYYKMKFETSTFSIESKRTISGYFGGKNHTIEITNEMLWGYKFINNIYSFNCQLLLQMKKSNGKRSSIRIPLSLVSKKGKKQLSDILSNIIEDNNK